MTGARGKLLQIPVLRAPVALTERVGLVGVARHRTHASGEAVRPDPRKYLVAAETRCHLWRARAWPFWNRWQRIAFRWSRSKSPAGMGPWRCRATSSRGAASSAGVPRIASLLRRTVWSGGQQQSRSLLPPRRRGRGPRSGGGCGRGAARTAIHRARTSRTWRSPPRKGDHACRVRRHAHRDRLRGSWPASLRHGSGRAGQDRDPDDRWKLRPRDAGTGSGFPHAQVSGRPRTGTADRVRTRRVMPRPSDRSVMRQPAPMIPLDLGACPRRS